MNLKIATGVAVGVVGLVGVTTKYVTKRKTNNEHERLLQHNEVVNKKKVKTKQQQQQQQEKNPKPKIGYSIPHNTTAITSQNSINSQAVSSIDEPVKLFQSVFESTYKQSQDINTRPVCVLVLDGGGLRGTLTCEILTELENKLKLLSGNNDYRIADSFDLIMGTSTGGLLSLGLGKLHWSVDDCLKLYYSMAEKVFGGREHDSNSIFDSIYDSTLNFWHKSKSVVTSLTRKTISMYSSDKFRSVLLKAIKVDANTPLYISKEEYLKTKQPLVATVATEVNWPDASYPAILRSYSIYQENLTKFPIFPGSSNISIIQSAMATSAAPSYFDPVFAKIKGPDGKTVTHKLVDGGLNSNDPVMIAYCEAQVLWPNRKIFIVSVGTGQAEVDLSKSPKGGFAVVTDLVSNSFGSLFSAKEATNSMCISVLGHLDILDCVRLNPKIDPKKTAMDDPSLMKYWREAAQDYVKKENINQLIHDIAVIALQSSKFDILKEANL